MRSFALPFASACAVAFVALALGPACTTTAAPSSTYFDRTISPVLTTSCVRTNTGAGCHVADAKGNSLGNLDVSTYAQLSKRADLLLDYGPYGQPALLVKNVAPFSVNVQTFDGTNVTVTTDIKHAGGSILDPTASAYQTLRRWIDNGATENNTGVAPAAIVKLPCSTFVPVAQGFDPTTDPTTPDFPQFSSSVNSVLGSSCAAANCHGTQANELYLTCGSAPDQLRWNYFAASGYIGETPDESELLRRPLAPSQGGSFHEGGIVFATSTDPGYEALSSWALAHGPPDTSSLEPNFLFFAHRVQPEIVKKGCMMIQCHSASMFHEYRLRGGAGGAFSLSATKKNYDLSFAQLNLESPDPSSSRIIRKNLYRPDNCGVSGCDKAVGVIHRGGPLLEDFQQNAASPAQCAAITPAINYDTDPVDNIPAYCMLSEWLRREQASAALKPLSAIAYVSRPLAPTLRTQDFDVYTPGATLHLTAASLSATGALTTTTDTVVNTACGLDTTNADIRKPAVSWDGTHIAFAARTSATTPLQIYEMKSDGTGCAPHAIINQGGPSGNGLLIHNFDPAYSATGQIVFASTRGNILTTAYDYTGPQRTPADPTKPNSNIYVFDPAATPNISQLTYLLNMERYPSFMTDGRVIMTTEKREPGFYELALRRINLDGGDYHPLYSQRGSIGYVQSSRVVELSDKNFAAIMNDPGAAGEGGALAVFNRSVGVDFTSANAADYPVDPTVIDPTSASSPEVGFFLHSLRFPDVTSFGHPGQPTSGVYTAPAPLPGGLILVSYGTAADPATFNGDYDLYVVDPSTGTKTKLLGTTGVAEVDAVAVFQRAPRTIFVSAPDEPNGVTQILPGHTEADITVLDFPVLGSLLFQNTPTGRILEDLSSGVDIYEEMPPPVATVTTFDQGGTNVVSDTYGKVFVQRRLLGHVPISSDGSTHFQVPGGLPILYQLPVTTQSTQMSLPRVQREEIEFAPGEYAHQSFRREFFNGLCANCHGSISGQPIDTALLPDMLTEASDTLARGSTPINLNLAPGQRGPIVGPPASP